jgi:hypothetical protein
LLLLSPSLHFDLIFMTEFLGVIGMAMMEADENVRLE